MRRVADQKFLLHKIKWCCVCRGLCNDVISEKKTKKLYMAKIQHNSLCRYVVGNADDVDDDDDDDNDTLRSYRIAFCGENRFMVFR